MSGMRRPRRHDARGRRALDFTDVVVPAAPKLERATPLRYEIEYPDCPPLVIDFTSYPATPLFRALASQPAQIARSMKRSALLDNLSALRKLCDHLSTALPLVRRLEDVTARVIDDYEQLLRGRYGPTSTHWFTCLKLGIWWLKGAIRSSRTTISSELKERLAYVTNSGKPKGRALEPLDPATHAALVAACKVRCREVLKRITVTGEDLLRTGRDPRLADGREHKNGTSGGWRKAANWVWMAEHMLDGGQIMTNQWAKDVERVFSIVNCTRQPFARLGDVYAHRYPTSLDLVPFLIRLILKTRLPPECVIALTVDSLVASEDNDTLYYIKERSGHKELQSLTYPKSGPGSVAWLFHQVLQVTEHARARHPTDSLWIAFTLQSGYGFRVARFENSGAIRAFLRETEIIRGDGKRLTQLDLRRLRKTPKVQRYIQTGGNISAWADDHSPEVADRHYGRLESLLPLHEETVARAQVKALELATSATTVLLPKEEKSLRAHPSVAARRLGVPRPRVLPVLSGATDVFLAACKDIRNSPFAKSGELCPATAWGCFDCHNAVVASRHLPVQLTYLDWLEDRRSELTPDEWQEAFARVHAQATAIVRLFPDPLVLEARAVARSLKRSLHLPITMVTWGGLP